MSTQKRKCAFNTNTDNVKRTNSSNLKSSQGKNKGLTSKYEDVFKKKKKLQFISRSPHWSFVGASKKQTFNCACGQTETSIMYRITNGTTSSNGTQLYKLSSCCLSMAIHHSEDLREQKINELRVILEETLNFRFTSVDKSRHIDQLLKDRVIYREDTTSYSGNVDDIHFKKLYCYWKLIEKYYDDSLNIREEWIQKMFYQKAEQFHKDIVLIDIDFVTSFFPKEDNVAILPGAEKLKRIYAKQNKYHKEFQSGINIYDKQHQREAHEWDKFQKLCKRLDVRNLSEYKEYLLHINHRSDEDQKLAKHYISRIRAEYTPGSKCYILECGNDVLTEILGKLNHQDVLHCGLVCKAFYALYMTGNIWTHVKFKELKKITDNQIYSTILSKIETFGRVEVLDMYNFGFLSQCVNLSLQKFPRLRELRINSFVSFNFLPSIKLSNDCKLETLHYSNNIHDPSRDIQYIAVGLGLFLKTVHLELKNGQGYISYTGSFERYHTLNALKKLVAVENLIVTTDWGDDAEYNCIEKHENLLKNLKSFKFVGTNIRILIEDLPNPEKLESLKLNKCHNLHLYLVKMVNLKTLKITSKIPGLQTVIPKLTRLENLCLDEISDFSIIDSLPALNELYCGEVTQYHPVTIQPRIRKFGFGCTTAYFPFTHVPDLELLYLNMERNTHANNMWAIVCMQKCKTLRLKVSFIPSPHIFATASLNHWCNLETLELICAYGTTYCNESLNALNSAISYFGSKYNRKLKLKAYDLITKKWIFK